MVCACLVAGLSLGIGVDQVRAAPALPTEREFECLRRAIEDLTDSFGPRYAQGREYAARLAALEQAARRGDAGVAAQFAALKHEALLANPLLGFERLLLIKRKPQKGPEGLGFPSNHECNSSLARLGYDNEIAVLAPVAPGGTLQPLFRPDDGGYVGEIDLHWDAQRLLFTRSTAAGWSIWEIRADGGGLRRVSQAPEDVDCFDACYLPDGRIIFGSTASYQAVPCWHGRKLVSNLYVMNADGSGMRQVCFDQDHDFHPCVMPNGQVIYHRWDYTGINHIFMRQLMLMNPDGTGQRAIYGSNSWFPNALYFPRPLPNRPGGLVCILSGYHGVHRMGQLVLVDTQRGWQEEKGLVLRISGRGDPIQPAVRDRLVDDDWPKFLHPWPLSDKYFLVACAPRPDAPWGIYLADVFDNLVLLREEPGDALLEPVPLVPRPRPPVIPSRVDRQGDDAVVYLHDVYAGPGLAGVPRGTIKRLRVVAYHFGYPGLAGPDKIGFGGPWEVMRILGTVGVEEDGSALFRVPACTPVAIQALDAEGKAVQLMRSWFTAMPGEKVSCVGCHESPQESGRVQLARAAVRVPEEIQPWYGPARGFDFAREVQPVLDKYCVGCHQGGKSPAPDLRCEQLRPDYQGRLISKLGVERLHPKMAADTKGILRFTPAYEALLPYVRRVSIEDDVSLLVPGEYHADTSPLIQILRKGHGGVALDGEAWDRLVTWIDLNAPCHGTWGEVYPIPDNGHQRRMALRAAYGGPQGDPEVIPQLASSDTTPVLPRELPPPQNVALPGWPFDARTAQQRQAALGQREMTIELANGVSMKLVLIPPGKFVMGDAAGEPDEYPLSAVTIAQPFWIGACEVTNAQFRCFDPGHDSRYYQKRHARSDDQGLTLNEPQQPAVRVSWQQAMAFCRWLSQRTSMEFTLPTEAQWEYACRAGTDTPLSFGPCEADFSTWANVGDWSFANGSLPLVTGGLEHLILEGGLLADARFDDGSQVTTAVGRYRPNAWGLYDMHGNAAEWTRSLYRPYPYHEDDGRNDPRAEGRRVVRGGSFFDRPARARSGFRLAYPAWQRVFNVGFRVVCEEVGSG